MKDCRVYLNNDPYPILIKGYIGHKIRQRGYSEFYGLFRSYYIQNKDIRYISIDTAEGVINCEKT